MNRLILCILLLASLGFALVLPDNADQQKMIQIARVYGMSEQRAKEFTSSLITHSTSFNINPWFMFYLAIAESGLKNIVGDDGASVGYFQLHVDTLKYLKARYKIKVPKDHQELIKNIDLQIYIACFYVKLLYDRHKDLDKVLECWNGSKKFVAYYKQVASYVIQVYGG